MMLKILAMMLAISPVAFAQEYQFTKKSYTMDNVSVEITFVVNVNSSYNTTLDEKLVQKAVDVVAKKNTMNRMIAYRFEVADMFTEELNKLLANGKRPAIDSIQILTMSFNEPYSLN